MARGLSVRHVRAPFSTRQEHGAVVVSVTRTIDDGLFSKLDAEVRRAPVGEPFIINLSALTLGSARAVEQLVVFLRSLSGPRVCLVCGRLSARKLLRFAGAADIVPVFMTTADAVQALVLQRHGYGSGWSMTNPIPDPATGPPKVGEGLAAG